jgi:signal transduction histidine kinase
MAKAKNGTKRSGKAGTAGGTESLREKTARFEKKLKDERQLSRKTEESLKILYKELEKKNWVHEKTRDFIKILYKELEKKNKELERFDQLKSQFVANVSHEFKNPLAVIRESFGIVLDGTAGEINPNQEKFLKLGKKNTERLIRLVTDMLDLARIESGKMKMKREKLDIGSLADEVAVTCEKELLDKQISFKMDIKQDIGMIWGDKDKITEVILNLLNNSIKYTPSGGTVAIRIEDAGEEILFEISDTGPGIPKKDHEKIFDKFERITTKKQEGTGLGLPIAKDIVELHRGKIWVESEPGKGSKFIFTLPRDLRKTRRP